MDRLRIPPIPGNVEQALAAADNWEHTLYLTSSTEHATATVRILADEVRRCRKASSVAYDPRFAPTPSPLGASAHESGRAIDLGQPNE